jgi:hypothetical protein
MNIKVKKIILSVNHKLFLFIKQILILGVHHNVMMFKFHYVIYILNQLINLPKKIVKILLVGQFKIRAFISLILV